MRHTWLSVVPAMKVNMHPHWILTYIPGGCSNRACAVHALSICQASYILHFCRHASHLQHVFTYHLSCSFTCLFVGGQWQPQTCSPPQYALQSMCWQLSMGSSLCIFAKSSGKQSTRKVPKYISAKSNLLHKAKPLHHCMTCTPSVYAQTVIKWL